ncbi:MAG: thioredoxin family protein [Candidatus Lokiarchaeota archaeon]|nr:thioredoxin family protein [Candidatus Lokiarchaeota archaeon]
MSEVFKEGYPKILLFSSVHCAPCKPVEEMLKRINISMFGKKLLIEKIDVVKNYMLTQQYKITSIPTLIIADKKLSINIQEEDIIDAILFGFISSVRI